MALRLILLVIVVVVIVGIFAGFFDSSAMMRGVLQTLPTPVVTVAYAGEINQISSLVEDFIELRNNRHSDDAKKMAGELDLRINELELVKMFCSEKINSFELAFEKNPYQKLQKICPPLKDLSLSKAAQYYRQI